MDDWGDPHYRDHGRREFHAAHARSFTAEAARQILMAYRGQRYATVAPGFKFKPGFIYVQVRAISARINQNFDGWPSEELKKSYRSFLGKPCFVNHHNFDPAHARGKVVAARYVEAGDDKYAETVMEIDAMRFPKLAHEIKTGGLDSVSMGVEAGFTICSYCDHRAVDVPEFCAHVKFHKGETLPRINARTGATENVLVYEKCYKLGFFELSFVFDPADETAVASRVIAASLRDAENCSPGDLGCLVLPNKTKAKAGQGATGLDTVGGPSMGTSSPSAGAGTSSGGGHGQSQGAPSAGGPPSKDLTEALQRAGIHPEMYPLISGFSATEGNNPSGAPTLGFTDSQAGTTLDQHAQALAKQLQDRQSVSGPFPSGKSPQEQAAWMATVVGQNGSPSDWQGNAQPARSDYVNNVVKGMPGQGSPVALPAPAAPTAPQAPSMPKPLATASVRHLEAHIDKLAALGGMEARINRLAYGEIEAPEDVDTLRDEDNDDGTDEFKHYVESPKELRGPDLDQTKQLDRAQEQEGLDSNRRVEDVEDIGGAPQGGSPMPTRNARGAPVLVDPRTGRRYYAADEDAGPPPDGPPPPDDGGGGPPPPGGPPAQSDEELIAEAEADLEQAEAAEGGDDGGPPPDDGGPPQDEDASPPPDDDSDDGGGDDSDLPPWLTDGSSPDDSGPPPPPPTHESRRRPGNQRSSTQKKRRTTQGGPMGLASRGRVATAGRRQHYADDSGHVDGGPYHMDDNDQGQQEDIFLSETPGSEAVAAPVPGDGTISNTENNLVASKLQQRIQARNEAQRRDMIAWEQVTGQRVGARRTADDGEWPNPGAESVSNTATPEEHDPELSGTDEQGLRGDFDSIALDHAETQPNDRSAAVYAAFDRWLHQTTGRSARQHANPNFIRRSAARWCSASGVAVESMFPVLGIVLREARSNEGTNRRSDMRRRADTELDVAAPQDRIDVEAPVSNTTDADAQASQFDLGDFGNNAGDDLADPELSPDSQIWAPGEGDGQTKSSNRKADGITAVRYAEAYIAAGLAPNTPQEKWKIAGLAQTMRHGTIVDRIRLLDAVNTSQRASSRRTAANRGAGRGLPPGVGQRQLSASNGHSAASDTATDSALFFKG